jgi:hypothetical protein
MWREWLSAWRCQRKLACSIRHTFPGSIKRFKLYNEGAGSNPAGSTAFPVFGRESDEEFGTGRTSQSSLDFKSLAVVLYS